MKNLFRTILLLSLLFSPLFALDDCKVESYESCVSTLDYLLKKDSLDLPTTAVFLSALEWQNLSFRLVDMDERFRLNSEQSFTLMKNSVQFKMKQQELENKIQESARLLSDAEIRATKVSILEKRLTEKEKSNTFWKRHSLLLYPTVAIIFAIGFFAGNGSLR